MNALEASQRINVLCDKLEGISFMYEQFKDGKVLEEAMDSVLEEESNILGELKFLQDKLEAIDISQ